MSEKPLQLIWMQHFPSVPDTITHLMNPQTYNYISYCSAVLFLENCNKLIQTSHMLEGRMKRASAAALSFSPLVQAGRRVLNKRFNGCWLICISTLLLWSCISSFLINVKFMNIWAYAHKRNLRCFQF